MTAVPNDGFRFVKWEVVGLTLENDEDNPVTFEMPAGEVRIVAVFEPISDDGCDCELVCKTCGGCRTCRDELGVPGHTRVANASTGAPAPASDCTGCDDDDCKACVCHVLGNVRGNNGDIAILDAVAALQAFAKVPNSLVMRALALPAPNRAPLIAAQVHNSTIGSGTDNVVILDAVGILQGFAKLSNATADGSIDGRNRRIINTDPRNAD